MTHESLTFLPWTIDPFRPSAILAGYYNENNAHHRKGLGRLVPKELQRGAGCQPAENTAD